MRVAFVRGTTIDRDFVHWRMAALEAGMLDINPGDANILAGFDLGKFMLISWRIRSWKLSGSFSFDYTFLTDTATYTVTLTDAPIFYQKILSITNVPDFSNRPLINGTPALAENQIMDFANPKFREWGSPFPYVEVDPPTFAVVGNLLTPIGGVAGIQKLLGNDRPFGDGTTVEEQANSFTTQITDDIPLFTRTVTGGATLNPINPAPPSSPRASVGFRALSFQPPVAVAGQIPQNRVLFDGDETFYPWMMLKGFGQANFTFPGPTAQNINHRFGLSPGVVGGGFLGDVTSGNLTILGNDIPIYMGVAGGGASNFQADFTLTPVEYWAYANSLGSPVFNTSTGAQLIDPFS